MSALRDGASVADVLNKAGTGYIEYEAEVVSTTKKASRGLERARYVEMDLRSDFAGAAAAFCESVEDASGGRGTSATSAPAASAFNRFLRRCGGSSAGGTWLLMFAAFERVGSPPLTPASSPPKPSCASSCPLLLVFRNAFVQKNVLSTFSSLATALWDRLVVEWRVRAGVAFASLRAHRVHIVLLGMDRNRVAVAGRESMRDGFIALGSFHDLSRIREADIDIDNAGKREFPPLSKP